MSGAQRSILMVTTVSSTMHFLMPYVRHFRAQGVRVEGAAAELARDPRATEFDAVHDVPFSRSIKDLGRHRAAASGIGTVLDAGYDIVHVHTPIASFITRAVASRMPQTSRPAIVCTAHGFHFYRGGPPLTNAIFRTAERVAGRWTDRLVVINEEDRSAAERYRLVPRGRLRYMPGIGVDTEWYSRDVVPAEATAAALAGLGIEAGRPYFVVVGELSRRKRPTDAVRALAHMRERDPLLVLLGDGRERPAVMQLAQELGVADRVLISPTWVADVRPFLVPAIALVQTSQQEGLPRSIMEALALEVPVATTAARGCPELVGKDRGYVVPVGATVELAAAMDRLVSDPQDRAAMGRRGRQLMVDRFDQALLIEEHERLYAELWPDA